MTFWHLIGAYAACALTASALFWASDRANGTRGRRLAIAAFTLAVGASAAVVWIAADQGWLIWQNWETPR